MALEKLALEALKGSGGSDDLEPTVRKVIGEYVRRSSEQEEPALKSKLSEERKRREKLEGLLNELKEENRQTRQRAEQAERFSRVRDSLRDMGVQKTELAFRLVKDEIFRGEDGELYAESGGGRVPYQEHLADFVAENPEFLPPRISGGSGATGAGGSDLTSAGFDLDRIRPGMKQEELAQAWKEVARLAGQGSESR